MRFKEKIKPLFTRKYWKGFKGRYIITIISMTSLVAVFMSIFLPEFVYRTNLKLFQEQSETLNAVLLESIGISLEFADYESIQLTFEKIGAKEAFLVYLDVQDNTGKSLARFRQDEDLVLSLEQFADDRFLTHKGILANYHQIGIGSDDYTLILALDTALLDTLRLKLQHVIGYFVTLCVLFIVLGMILLVEWLNRPLDVLIERMQDVATGEADLTREIEVRSEDEFGALSHWFNTFLGRIREMVTLIKESSASVDDVGDTLLRSSAEMADVTGAQQRQIVDISTSIQEMAANISESSRFADEALESARLAMEKAEGGGEIVKQNLANMDEISAAVQESSRRIGELGSRSSKIGDIVAVIDNIADQTNLLALNANIEAARAGEHGRGFAVVADEVRVLAERTIQATKEIGQMIQDIQEGTNQVVEAMDRGMTTVNSGVTYSNQAGEALEHIIRMNGQVQEAIQRIAVGSTEQDEGAQLIASNVEEIKTFTEKSARQAQAVSEAANQLKGQTSTLKDHVDVFKLA